VTPYRRWRYALKPASWPKLFVPAFVGQAIGAAHLGGVDLVSAAGGLGLTFLLLGAIVLSNDLADREVDGLKRRLFPTSCSPKTIPDGILSAGHVALGALVFTAAAIGFGYYCNDWLGRPLMGIATLGALAVFAGYSLWPLKLNYRGGGELLEMFGVGLVLPWINAYAQGGLGVESLTWLPRPWAILPGVCALAFASAIASGLSDEVSDRKGGKRTFTTMLGNPMARRFAEANVLLAAILWLLAGIFSAHIPLVVAVFGALVLAYYLRTLVALSPAAVTNAFDAQRRYKDVLHRAFWNSAQWLAGLLVLHRLFF
jgi:1,4-dihydroxy-2-naphthoate octaprenyltransferase/chlorophyll synthase